VNHLTNVIAAALVMLGKNAKLLSVANLVVAMVFARLQKSVPVYQDILEKTATHLIAQDVKQPEEPALSQICAFVRKDGKEINVANHPALANV